MMEREENRGAPELLEKACFYCGHTAGEHLRRAGGMTVCSHLGCDCAFFEEGKQ